MIDKGLYRKNFSVGGRDGPASGGAPGPGDTGGGGGYESGFTDQRGNVGSSPTSTGGGDNQFAAPGTLSDIRERQDYFGPTRFGPARKFTGSFLDNIFGGGYRPVTPSGNFQSRFSQMGGLGKGILSSLIGSALGIPGIIASIPSGIQTLGSRFSDSRLGNYLSNLNEKLQKDFSVAGTYVPEEDEDEVETIDIRDKYNRLGIVNPNLITPTNLNDYLGYRNREYIESTPSSNPQEYDFFSNAMAEITDKDREMMQTPVGQMMDYDTFKAISGNETLTPQEFEQLRNEVT